MKIRNYIMLLLLSGLFSCEKIMQEAEVNLSDLSTEESMLLAVNGMYNRLARMHQTYYFTPIVKGDDITYYSYHNRMNPLVDNENNKIYPKVDDNGNLLLINSPLIKAPEGSFYNSESYVTEFIWEYTYRVIIAANNIIDKYEKGEIPENLIAFVGEAYFIRAYAYFRLARLFGQARFVDDVDVKYNLPLIEAKELFVFIESDLKQAILLIPVNNTESRIVYVTPHKGTAKALLAQVYLTMGGYPCRDEIKYTQAAEIAKELIDSAVYYGFGLLDDFANLWTGPEGNYNKESIFSCFYNPSLGLGYEGYKPEYEVLNLITLGHQEIIVETDFYNKYPKSYRKNNTFMNHLIGSYFDLVYTGFDSTNQRYMLDTILFLDFNHYYDTIAINDNLSLLKQNSDSRYLKYNFPIGSNDVKVNNYAEKINHSKSLYVFRYAHVLLTYAEARARSIKPDALAYEAINKVRRRANKLDINSPSEYDLQPGLSTEQFIDSVVWERAWEFCGEFEGRWFDLLRLEMVEKLPKLRHPLERYFPEEDDVITEEDYYLKAPEGDFY